MPSKRCSHRTVSAQIVAVNTDNSATRVLAIRTKNISVAVFAIAIAARNIDARNYVTCGDITGYHFVGIRDRLG